MTWIVLCDGLRYQVSSQIVKVTTYTSPKAVVDNTTAEKDHVVPIAMDHKVKA